MSAYRHFQDKGTGQVISVTSPSLAAAYATSPADFEEVQTAPLDSVVIDGPLPEVDTRNGAHVHHASTYTTGWDAAYLAAGNGHEKAVASAERQARAFAAIAAYLREQKSVDEAQVVALTRALSDTHLQVEGGISHFFATTARNLVARHGVRVEGATS
jgi:hypothetical protein